MRFTKRDMASLKVVFDTNVYVSAFLFGKIVKRVIDLAEEKKCQIFISLPILEELRDALSKKFDLPKKKIDQFTKAVLNKTLIVPVFGSLKTPVTDPKDNRVIETGSEAKVDFIITGDKHLLKLKAYKNIQIISPAKFLKILKEKK